MKSLIEVLENAQHRLKEITNLMRTSATDLESLSNRAREPTSDNLLSLTNLFRTRNTLPSNSPAIFLNIGSHSIGVVNITICCKHDHEPNNAQNLNNMEHQKSKSTKGANQKSLTLVYTPQLIDKLSTLQAAATEFATEFRGKTYEQFMAERNCIAELLQEVDKEVVTS